MKSLPDYFEYLLSVEEEVRDLEIVSEKTIYESFNSATMGFIAKVIRYKVKYKNEEGTIRTTIYALVVAGGIDDTVVFGDPDDAQNFEKKLRKTVRNVQKRMRKQSDADFVHTDKQELKEIRELFEQ